jgi:adenosylhomocysteinase
MRYDVRDLSLSAMGATKVEWAGKNMPVMHSIAERFDRDKPLAGLRVSACLHVTAETANLMIALKKGGAVPVLCASNPLSTQDDVAANLVREHKIPVFAVKGEDNDTYYKHIEWALEHEPHVTMDDGADLVTSLHSDHKEMIPDIIGSTEETTTGVIRLRSMEREKVLAFPIIAVNDSQTKRFFDNRYGTGQSTLDGIMRATNILLAGQTFVVCGYGMCGRGLAHSAQGLNAHVVVVEVDPIHALEATMDGYRVMPIDKAAPIGDIFVTVTGNKDIIRKEHFVKMKNNSLLANSGHFNVEIDLVGLDELTVNKRKLRSVVVEHELENGRRINVLADGRLINLAAAEGHPAMVMDMSFANQALAVEYLYKNKGKLENKVYVLPAEMDREIARLKLKTMGIEIDDLTEEQKKYLDQWQEGT